jgi:outer membrane protein assembly factor BamD
MSRVILTILFLVSVASALSGCSSADKHADSPEGSYALAQQFDKDERYDEAIKHYQDLKNKFPYSRYATMSELAIADDYFKQESYPEAQVAYQAFKDMHPKHPQVDYVTYKLAMSFFNQLPSTVDRDLSLAKSAILYFDEVLTQYPNSQYASECRDKKIATLKMLAGKEQYIADFYYKRSKYDSALLRYDDLLNKYPNLGFDEKALSRAAICAARSGEPDKAKKYLSTLESKFPKSGEISAARRAINKVEEE